MREEFPKSGENALNPEVSVEAGTELPKKKVDSNVCPTNKGRKIKASHPYLPVTRYSCQECRFTGTGVLGAERPRDSNERSGVGPPTHWPTYHSNKSN